jgi:hypothetical protein
MSTLDPERIQVPKVFLNNGDINLGPITWNPHRGEVKITPGLDEGAGGITANRDEIELDSDTLRSEAAPENTILGGNAIDNRASEIPSTPLTPFSILGPDNSEFLFLLTLGSEIIKGLEELDRDEYKREIKYIYEVIDYDSFLPE